MINEVPKPDLFATREVSVPVAQPDLDLSPRTANKSFRRVLLVGMDATIVMTTSLLVHARFYDLSGMLPTASLIAIPLIWMGLLNLLGFYNLKRFLPFHQRIYELFKVFCVAMLTLSALFYLAPELGAPRSITWLTGMFNFGMLVAWRTSYHRLLPMPALRKRLLVVGAGAQGRLISEEIRKSPKHGYQVVGFIDDDPTKLNAVVGGHVVLGDGRSLPDIARANQVDAVVLAISQGVQEATLKAVGDCIEQGYEIMDMPKLYERVSGRVPVLHVSHAWFIYEFDEANRRLYNAAKRAVDLSCSLLGLFATALLFPLIALLIKLDSPGPVLYSQVRIGKKGKAFKIYKFRTMVQDSEKDGAVWARVNDARVTKLGSFLRRTRLDELPQLYNVLVGDMSMVGPRPERPEFVAMLAEEIPFFSRRHMVLPGITGWAQVNYPYGASTEDALQKLHFDLFYIKNRSLFLDLEILFRTIFVVLKKTGSR